MVCDAKRIIIIATEKRCLIDDWLIESLLRSKNRPKKGVASMSLCLFIALTDLKCSALLILFPQDLRRRFYSEPDASSAQAAAPVPGTARQDEPSNTSQ